MIQRIMPFINNGLSLGSIGSNGYEPDLMTGLAAAITSYINETKMSEVIITGVTIKSTSKGIYLIMGDELVTIINGLNINSVAFIKLDYIKPAQSIQELLDDYALLHDVNVSKEESESIINIALNNEPRLSDYLTDNFFPDYVFEQIKSIMNNYHLIKNEDYHGLVSESLNEEVMFCYSFNKLIEVLYNAKGSDFTFFRELFDDINDAPFDEDSVLNKLLSVIRKI